MSQNDSIPLKTPQNDTKTSQNIAKRHSVISCLDPKIGNMIDLLRWQHNV